MEITASHIVANYLWHRMQVELGYSAADYGSLRPFSVGGNQQELSSFSKPFVLMSWSHQPNNIWLINTEIASYTIYSHDQSDVADFIELAQRHLKKMDEAATAINNWIAGLGPEYDPYDYFDFKTISMRSAVGAQPPMQEGGRFDGSIVLSIDYTYLG